MKLNSQEETNEDDKLTRGIIDLIATHFHKTGKYLGAVRIKFDDEQLTEKRLVLRSMTREWKYPKEKKKKKS